MLRGGCRGTIQGRRSGAEGISRMYIFSIQSEIGMDEKVLLSGEVHGVPEDVAEALSAQDGLIGIWNALTPLARNEWICWVESVKQEKTRREHVERLAAELREGKKRPCCWPGCPHRAKKTQRKAGNPNQDESGTKAGDNRGESSKEADSIDRFIEAKVPDRYKPVVEKFRRFVAGEFPELREEMRGGTDKYYGVPVYRYKRIVLTLSPTQKGITFSFSEGRKFEDRYGLLEGEGNKTLNLRIGGEGEYSEDVLRYYLRQAVEFDSR